MAAIFHRTATRLLSLGLVSAVAVAGAVETITVNPAATHQTIEAWGSAWGAYAWSERPALRQHLMEEWVTGLGLTRTRIETQGGNLASGRGPGDPLGGRAWEWLNDDGDPEATTTGTLNTAIVDELAASYYVPFKHLVEADGDQFTSYLSATFFDGGSSGQAPSWLINSPGEHAEAMLSNLLHLKNAWGITPDYTVVINEPGNQSAFSPAIEAPVIRELGARMQAAGLPTKIQFAEGIDPASTWNFISALQNDPTVWPYIGMLSYHLYGSMDPWRANIRDFGNARGIPRAQTEYLSQDVNVLYDDLTLGEVSVWEIYGVNPTYLPINAHSWFSRAPSYWNVRQVTRYVRPGAVRVDATSTSTSIRPLAFAQNGTATVVLWNNSGGPATSVNVGGLAPGSYAVCSSTNGTYQEAGLVTASAGGVITGVNVPAGAIVTIHPHGANQAPTMVDWKSSSVYLTQPASTTTLSASAQDTEGDAIAYAWSVTSKPVGVAVALATPGSATTNASGMTVAGTYVFTIAVSDPTHTITRTVEVTVHPGNQPPEIYDCHNRLPVWVTLPTSGTTLRIKTFDLEGDPLSPQWSVISQPAGANAVLANPNTNSCDVTQMTVSGDYVFQIALSDPTHTVTQTLTVPVFPANQAPVISAINANPAALTLPTATSALTATTSDPDANAIALWRPSGDVLSHWWSVQSAPAGANPVFATPGQRNTTVSGLTVAGTYVFTLKALDRTMIASQNVTITVAAATVNVAPTITTNPASLTVVAGQTATFTVAASGSGTLSYQWKQGTTNVGTNSATLSIPNAQAANAGSYTVVVTNSAGSATSTAAILTVLAATVAPTITTNPSNASVTAGQTATFTVAASGTAPLSYLWKQGSTNVGTNSATLSIPNAQAANAGFYTVVVTNNAGSATSTAATLTVNAAATAPTITTNPVNVTVTAGQSATFAVVASGTATLSYQWKFGTASVGTNSSTLSIPNAQAANAGSYTVVITNSAGSATSTNATLTVNAAATAPTITTNPANVTVTAGATATFTVAATGTAPLSYRWKLGTTNVGTNSATLTISNAQAANAGSYTVIVTNSVGSATSTAATLTVNAGLDPLIAWTALYNDGGGAYNGFSNTADKAFDANTTTCYDAAAANGAFTGIDVGAGKVGTVTSIRFLARSGWLSRMIGGVFEGSNTLGSGYVALATVATASDTAFTTITITGAAPNRYLRYRSPNGGFCNVAEIEFHGTVTTGGPVVIAPSIATNPANVTITAGATATFTVAATGTAPLTYQWKQGSINVGTNSAALTISNAQAANDGSYTCVVTNSAGSATSTAATLTVNAATTAPTITTNPAKLTITAGATATFTVAATGTAPLTYQWKQGTTNVGTNSATLSIPNAQAANAGSYTVVVTNSAGSATSTAATLTVNAGLDPLIAWTALYNDGGGAYNGFSSTADKAYDGNTTTYYDAAATNGAFTGIDVGAGKAGTVTSIRYRARSGWIPRMTGGVFEGSNTLGSGYVTLATVASASDTAFTTLAITGAAPYRYLRYRSPSGGFCNVAEIEFHGAVAAFTAPAAAAPATPKVVSVSGNHTAAPILSGTGDPGSTVMVIDGSTFLGSATVNADGTWVYPVGGIASGDHAIRVAATNGSGTSAASSPVMVTLASSPLPVGIIDTGASGGQQVGCGIGSGLAILLVAMLGLAGGRRRAAAPRT